MTTDRQTIHRSVCPLDCPDTCSMLVTVEDGVAVDLRGDPEHPFTRGFLCQKMARYLDRVYSPERLLHPMRRVGPKGERPIRADRLGRGARRRSPGGSRRSPRSADGPQAILPYSYYGTMGKLQSSSLDRRFFHRLGASMLDRTICATAGSLGYEYTVGRGRLGADPMAVPGCRFIVNWGSNTVQHEQPPLEPDDPGPQATARRSSRSTRTGARPPRGPTGTSSPGPAPTPPWRSA